MNSIEINIANLNNQTHIYIDIRNMQMKINNELNEITQEQVEELLRIIRTWPNDNNSKILDSEKIIIKIETDNITETIVGNSLSQKNYLELESWLRRV